MTPAASVPQVPPGVVTAEDAVRYFACGAGCKGEVIYCNYSTAASINQGKAATASATQHCQKQQEQAVACGGTPGAPSRYELFAVPVRAACKARHVVVSYHGVTEVE